MSVENASLASEPYPHVLGTLVWSSKNSSLWSISVHHSRTIGLLVSNRTTKSWRMLDDEARQFDTASSYEDAIMKFRKWEAKKNG